VLGTDKILSHFRSTLRKGTNHGQIEEGVCGLPGELLKTEFMEPMGLSAYELAKALNFPGICDVVRGDRAISRDAAIRLGKYFGLPAQFWLNLQNDYDLRIAEGSGIGKGIRPRKVAYDAEGADARWSITMRSLLAPSALTPS
jgi:addiction module HigA family antidote